MTANNSFDFIIVGAGSSGCVLANRLSADGRFRVLLLEAGPSDRNPWLHVPIGYARTYYDSNVNWMYRTLPDPRLNDRRDYWPRGKVLGGSSAINAMVVIRGQHADYDDWASLGAAGWSWQDVAPYFQKLETVKFSTNPLRGQHGPVHVSEIEPHAHKTNEVVLAACAELGFQRNPDFNADSQEGVNYYQINTRNGRRVSAARAYLTPARRRENLRIVCHAHVERLRFDGKTCTGVNYQHRGRQLTATAGREVIVAAGSINSPQLLECSGIGDGERLQSLGIEVRRHAPQVGENLQDHLGINYFYRSRAPTLNNQFSSLSGRIAAGLEYLLFRSGPLSISVNQCGGFIRSSAARPRPNIQLYYQPTSYISAPSGTRPMIRLDDFAAFNLGISQCRPTSRGSVHVTSPDSAAPPAIKPNYLSTEYDRVEMLEGVRLLRRLAETPALQRLVAEEIKPGRNLRSDDELLDDIGNRAGTVFHPTSTCRIGDKPDRGVVDHRLKVFGIERLRVIDASVFPTVISGNTNFPCMMIGERGADLILADYAT